VDLLEVSGELACKLRLNSDSTDEKIILDSIILSNGEEVKEWKLPYSTPLNYS
jgi:hypothetical protein